MTLQELKDLLDDRDVLHALCQHYFESYTYTDLDPMTEDQGALIELLGERIDAVLDQAIAREAA